MGGTGLLRRGALAALTAGVVAVPILASSSATATDDLVLLQPAATLSTHTVDVGGGFGGPGDLILEHGRVTHRSGAPAGDAVTRVQLIDGAGQEATFLLDCTIRLAAGSLTFHGAGELSALSDGITYTVTGGTGRFAGTRGTVRVTVTGGERPGARIAFDLTRR